jgi:hypothetical protein
MPRLPGHRHASCITKCITKCLIWQPLRCGSRLPWLYVLNPLSFAFFPKPTILLAVLSRNSSNLVQHTSIQPKYILKACQLSIYPPSLSKWLHKQRQQRHFAVQMLGQVLPRAAWPSFSLFVIPSLQISCLHFGAFFLLFPVVHSQQTRRYLSCS